MSGGNVEWIVIKRFDAKQIGAIGFVNGEAAMIVAFYDDRDGDQDGKVSWGEAIAAKLSPVSLEGRAVVEVAMAARTNLDVVQRDASFAQDAVKMWLNFAVRLTLDGIYAIYFARGVKMTGNGIAKVVTKNAVKGFAVRKGFEKAVKEAFEAATDRPLHAGP